MKLDMLYLSFVCLLPFFLSPLQFYYLKELRTMTLVGRH